MNKNNSKILIQDLLANYAKSNDSLLPTPCHKLSAGDDSNTYKNLYVKRDDLTGVALGGNKSRKLDFIFPQLISEGIDAIVSIGGAQSNFCRMLCAYGARYGISIDLVLGGVRPEKPFKANLLLDDLLGAKCHFIDTDEFEELEKKAQEYAQKLKDKGKKVFMMPLGGSYGFSTLGYMHAFDEIMSWSRQENAPLDYIIHSSGSGGTQAGLVIGKLMHNWPGEIIGMAVAYSKLKLEQKILNLCLEANALFNLGFSQEQIKTAIIIDDSYMGEGYAIATRAGSRALELFAKNDGLILDPTYTAKAASGLLDYLDSGKIRADAGVLFVHTGGAVGLFA